MKFDDKCVQCESTIDLNTLVKLQVDDKEYNVAVCDKHLSLTLLEIKNGISNKIEKVYMLLKQAKELGLDISVLDNKMTVIKDPKKEKQEDLKEAPVEGPQEEQSSKVKVNVKRKMTKARSISGKCQKAYASHDIDNMVSNEAQASGGKAPVVEEVELQTIEAKGGMPITIPRKIKENSGQTDIRVIKTNQSMLKFQQRSSS